MNPAVVGDMPGSVKKQRRWLRRNLIFLLPVVSAVVALPILVSYGKNKIERFDYKSIGGHPQSHARFVGFALGHTSTQGVYRRGLNIRYEWWLGDLSPDEHAAQHAIGTVKHRYVSFEVVPAWIFNESL